MKVSINELFSGIGSQVEALKRLHFDVDVVGISEIDKYAIKTYELLHGKVRNYGDITKIDKLDYADIWTYSFPCQDISSAGQQKGLENTRSGLLYEVKRLLLMAKDEGKLPKYLLLENVKNLVSKQFYDDFNFWLDFLSYIGYNNHWEVLNSKNYDIPQSRERVFVVSIRKDLPNHFEFPKKKKATKTLGDLLESNVDKSFYLDEEDIRRVLSSSYERQREGILCKNGISKTLTARDSRGPLMVALGDSEFMDRKPSGIQIILKNDDPLIYNKLYNIGVRKITPREYWRLMGYNDDQINRVDNVMSNSQMYRLAGNSIVVDVLEEIFRNLFKGE